MPIEATIAIIVSSLALIGSIVTVATSAKKNEVEVLRVIIQELKDRVNELEIDNRDLENWAERLVCQVKNVGLEPVKFIKSDPRLKGK